MKFARRRLGGVVRSSRRSAVKGFTLIELLVVVGIISILASIAVPNMLDAQTRAKVARIKNDMRVLATAVEAYQVVNNKYPKRHYGEADETINYLPSHLLPSRNTKHEDLKVLTTPVSFISSLPVDIFDKYPQAVDGNPPPGTVILLDYYDPIQAQRIYNARWINNIGNPHNDPIVHGIWRNLGYIIVSVGPDGHINWNQETYPTSPYRILGLNFYTVYNPLRGTNSIGNIFRLGHDTEPEKVFNDLRYDSSELPPYRGEPMP